MIAPLLVLKIAPFLLAGLLYAEWRESFRLKLAFKTPLSLLFVLSALAEPRPEPAYALLILTGLVLCLAGDVFLALGGRRAFSAGLSAFLLGHLAYLAGFWTLAPPADWLHWPAAVFAAVSAAVFFRLRPHLGRMLGPVLAYIVAITLMLVAAWAVRSRVDPTLLGGGMAFVGAGLFYVSDFFVARDRFVRRQFANRLAGLPLYYAGQFLLAFSVGRVG